MLNNIFDKKNIEYGLNINNDLPYDNPEDVALQEDQIIFTSLNNIFQHLVENDIYNKNLIENIQSKDSLPGPSVVSNTNIIYNSEFGKKFVLTSNNINDDTRVVHKTIANPDNTLSGPQLESENINFIIQYNGYYVAGTTNGIWQVINQYDNVWEKPDGNHGFDTNILNHENTICFAINENGLYENILDDYSNFIGTDHGIYARSNTLGWIKLNILENDTILNIFPDPKEKTVFISTPNGLYSYNGHKLIKERGIYSSVNDMAQLESIPSENRYLAATNNGIKQSQLAMTFDNIKVVNVFNGPIAKVIGDKTGLKYVFTNNPDKLYKYENNEFKDITDKYFKNAYINDAAYYNDNCYVIANGQIHRISYYSDNQEHINICNSVNYSNIYDVEIDKIAVDDDIVIVASDTEVFYSRIFNDDRNLKYWHKLDSLDDDLSIYEIIINDNKVFIRTNSGIRIYNISTDKNTFDLIFTNELSDENIVFTKNINDDIYICTATSCLYRYNDLSLEKIQNDILIKDIAEINGDTYIATSEGLRFCPSAINTINIDSNISTLNYISSIYNNGEFKDVLIPILSDDTNIINIDYIYSHNKFEEDVTAEYILINDLSGIIKIDPFDVINYHKIDGTDNTFTIKTFGNYIYAIKKDADNTKLYRLFIDFQKTATNESNKFDYSKYSLINDQYNTNSVGKNITAHSNVSYHDVSAIIHMNLPNEFINNHIDSYRIYLLSCSDLSEIETNKPYGYTTYDISKNILSIKLCNDIEIELSSVNNDLSDINTDEILGFNYDLSNKNIIQLFTNEKSAVINRNPLNIMCDDISVADVNFIHYAYDITDDTNVIEVANYNGFKTYSILDVKTYVSGLSNVSIIDKSHSQTISNYILRTKLSTETLNNNLSSIKTNSVADIYSYESKYHEVKDGINFVASDSGLYANRLQNKLNEIPETDAIYPTNIYLDNNNIILTSKHGLYSKSSSKKEFNKLINNVSASYINKIIDNNDSVIALSGGMFLAKSEHNAISNDFKSLIPEQLQHVLSNASCKDAIILDNALSTIIDNAELKKSIDVQLNIDGNDVDADISAINSLYDHLLICTVSYGEWIKTYDDKWINKNDLVYIKAKSNEYGELTSLTNAIDASYVTSYNNSYLTSFVKIEHAPSLINNLVEKYKDLDTENSSITSANIIDSYDNLTNYNFEIDYATKNIIELSDTISVAYSFINPYQLYDKKLSVFNDNAIGSISAFDLADAGSYVISPFSFELDPYGKNDNINILSKTNYKLTIGMISANNISNINVCAYANNNSYDNRLSSVDPIFEFSKVSSDTKSYNNTSLTLDFYSVLTSNYHLSSNIELSVSYDIIDSNYTANIVLSAIHIDVENESFIINEDYAEKYRSILYNEIKNEIELSSIYDGYIRFDNIADGCSASIQPINLNKINNLKNTPQIDDQQIRYDITYEISSNVVLDNISSLKLKFYASKHVLDNIQGPGANDIEYSHTFEISSSANISTSINSIYDGLSSDISSSIYVDIIECKKTDGLKPASICLSDMKISASADSYLIKTINFGSGGVHYLYDDKLSDNISFNEITGAISGEFEIDYTNIINDIYGDVQDNQDIRISSYYTLTINNTSDNLSIGLSCIDHTHPDVPINYFDMNLPQFVKLSQDDNVINFITINDARHDLHKQVIKYEFTPVDGSSYPNIKISADIKLSKIGLMNFPKVQSTNDLLYYDDVKQFQNNYIANVKSGLWALNLNNIFGRLSNKLNYYSTSLSKKPLGQTIYALIDKTENNNKYDDLIYIYDDIIRATPFDVKDSKKEDYLNVESAIDSGEISGNINCILKCNQGIAVGTNNGLYYTRYNDGQQYLYDKIKLNGDLQVNALVKDKANGNDYIYCATSKGLYVLYEIYGKDTLAIRTTIDNDVMLENLNVINVVCNKSRDNSIIAIVNDGNAITSYIIDTNNYIINAEVPYDTQHHIIGSIYDETYKKDIVLVKNDSKLYVRNKKYDYSNFIRLTNNALSGLCINDIHTSLESTYDYNDLTHFILISTNSGLYIKSYKLDSYQSIDQKDIRTGFHNISNDIIDTENIKSALVFNSRLYVLKDSAIYISKENTMKFAEIRNDAITNDENADFSSIDNLSYYETDLRNVDPIKLFIRDNHVYIMAKSSTYRIDDYDIIKIDELFNPDINSASVIDVYEDENSKKLIIGTYLSGLYEVSGNTIVKSKAINDISCDNIKFEKSTAYILENNSISNDVMVLEDNAWRYNQISVNTQFIDFNDNIVLGAVNGLYRRSITNELSLDRILDESEDIEQICIANDSLIDFYEKSDMLSTAYILKAYDRNYNIISTDANHDLIDIGHIDNKLIIASENDLKLYDNKLLPMNIITDDVRSICNSNELAIRNFLDTNSLNYMANDNILLSFTSFKNNRVFLDGVGSYKYLTDNYKSIVNQIYRINDKRFLLGLSNGLRYTIDNMISRRYKNSLSPELSISGNVLKIVNSNSVDETNKYLIAQDNKIFSTSNILDVEQEIKSIPEYVFVNDSQNNLIKDPVKIKDIYAESTNTYAIATNHGVYFTSLQYSLIDDLHKYTVDSVQERLFKSLCNALSVESCSHINVDHTKDSIITKLNNKMDTSFTDFPRNIYKDNFYRFANGVQMIENDVIESIEFNAGKGYIKAAVKNIITDRLGGESLYADLGYVVEFKDPNDKHVINMFNIEYIVKAWQSGEKEFCIYLPSTASYYMNNPYGFTTSKYAKADFPRDNIMRAGAFTNDMSRAATRIRLYLDNSHFNLTEIQEIQINGNSLPLKIYKDSVHCVKGHENLFDSVIMPSIVKTLPKSNDDDVNNVNNLINKDHQIVLDFASYGTDAQAIRILGR